MCANSHPLQPHLKPALIPEAKATDPVLGGGSLRVGGGEPSATEGGTVSAHPQRSRAAGKRRHCQQTVCVYICMYMYMFNTHCSVCVYMYMYITHTAVRTYTYTMCMYMYMFNTHCSVCVYMYMYITHTAVRTYTYTMCMYMYIHVGTMS